MTPAMISTITEHTMTTAAAATAKVLRGDHAGALRDVQRLRDVLRDAALPPTPDTSAAAVASRAREAFLARYAPSCACAPVEVREEHGALVCARCARPLRAREDGRE